MTADTLTIDIYSDVICPWCYIGKRRLDGVLAGPAGEGVSLRWRAYQLQPNVPPEGLDRRLALQRRYGSDADPSRVPSRIQEEASAEGLTLNYAAMVRVPNTLDAHRLLWAAYESGGSTLQHELAEALFRAHFCEGQDVGDAEVLAATAERCGWSRLDAQAALADPASDAAVRAELSSALEHGISGVPCYLLGGQFPFPGAQTPEVMQQFIERAKARLTA